MEPESITPVPKPVLLKDYLLDDLSSCSSYGFRSYPRRECCTTVRFLLETDLRVKPQKPVMYSRKLITGRVTAKSAPTASVVSALQRASKTVLNAVKNLQFAAAVKSLKQGRPKKAILPRRFSQKLLKRSSRKTATDHDEIKRWKAYNQLTEKQSYLSKFPPAIPKITDSKSSTSVTNSKSNSWSDSDFTVSDESLQSSSCNSDANSTEAQKAAIVAKGSSATKVVSSKSVGVTASNDSIDSDASTTYSPSAKKQLWSNEEKEQFSPVSVLDCPFGDEDEVFSPFRDKLNLVEGTTKKLMKKIKRFECLTQVEPLNLVKRIAFSESESESPMHLSLVSTPDIFVADFEEKRRVESKVAMLLHQLKARTPSCSPILKAADKLLLDFFRDKIVEKGLLVITDREYDRELVQVADDWINGKSCKFLYEWEVQKNRQAYMEDMEGGGKWKTMDKEHGQLALQLEAEVFTSLVNELVVDIV